MELLIRNTQAQLNSGRLVVSVLPKPSWRPPCLQNGSQSSSDLTRMNLGWRGEKTHEKGSLFQPIQVNVRPGTSESPVFSYNWGYKSRVSQRLLSQSRFYMTMDTTALLSFAVPLLLLILFKKFFERQSSRRINGPYPPGPKSMPIIGNVLDLLIKEQGPGYAEWSKKYQSRSDHFYFIVQRSYCSKRRYMFRNGVWEQHPRHQ